MTTTPIGAVVGHRVVNDRAQYLVQFGDMRDRQEQWVDAGQLAGYAHLLRAFHEQHGEPAPHVPENSGSDETPLPTPHHLKQAASASFFARRSGAARFPGQARLLFLNGSRVLSETEEPHRRQNVYCEEADPLLEPIYRMGAMRPLVELYAADRAAEHLSRSHKLPPAKSVAPNRGHRSVPPATLPCRSCTNALALFCTGCGSTSTVEAVSEEGDLRRPARPILPPPPPPRNPPSGAVANRRMVEKWVNSLPDVPLSIGFAGLRALPDDREPPRLRQALRMLHSQLDLAAPMDQCTAPPPADEEPSA
eukprot:GGOE01043177.1.p1 GENE.GGOE01043177.1~~GGOE01043177.1.p1  ORF type:complete len:335 (+),score=49.69 GGOE01043177.1:87-1007(+)